MTVRFRRTLLLTACGAATLAVLLLFFLVINFVAVGDRGRLVALTALAIGAAVAGGALAATMVSRPYEQRVAAMVAVARRYARGELERPLPDYGDDELGHVARAMDAAIHEIGRRLDALSRDRTRMSTILSSMVEGVLVVDQHGRLQHVNDAARRMLHLHHDAINHSYLEALRHPGIVDQLSRVLAGQEAEGLELSFPRGVTRTLVARVAPVIGEGRGAVLVLHDITDLRRADQMRRDFVANVSHELRTPLTAIKGYAEALLDEVGEDQAARGFVDIIHRHSTRMERLVHDLLRLARLDAGQEAAEFAPADITALIDGITADFQPLAADKRQSLHVAVAADASTLVVDATKLHDIVCNLVENAINYTPEGGHIDIAADVTEERFRLRVADTGPGIPVEDLTRVFERFYRVDKSRARPGGTGLGLSIVKNLVHVLGGEVTAANRPEGGAEFTVRLPRRHSTL